MTLLSFFPKFEIGYYLSIVFYLIVLVVTVRILLGNRNPSWSILMLLLMYFMPAAGLFFYFYNGVNWKKKKIVKKIPERIFKDNLDDLINKQAALLADVPPEYNNDAVKSMRMMLRSSGSILTQNNRSEFFFDGEQLFTRLLEDLENARRNIHMEYFIWRSDSLGERIKDILIRKASEGVEVRLLFDGVGCFRMMSYKYRRQLRKGGVKFRYFLDPLNPFSGRMLNYCNHRKIAVIDGIIAYTGGMNIGSEYIDGGKRFRSWRDTHMRLEGDAVNLLQAVFLADWENSGAGVGDEQKYLVHSDIKYRDQLMQIVTSGPDSDWHSIKELFFTLISNANEEVLIGSPYFIIDEAIEDALVTAALSGVRVRIIMAGNPPDKWIPFWAAQTFFERLIEAGVEIYQYQAGFYHSKSVVADGRICSVGTCNMDLRSFLLHYEVNAVIYSAETAQEIRGALMKDLELSRRITLAECRNLGFLPRLRNSALRILAPLL